MRTIVISNKPYAKFLAEGLNELDQRNIENFAIVGIDKNSHEVLTGYWKCGVADKAIMATNIQADALYDTVIANANQIVRAAEEQNEDEE